MAAGIKQEAELRWSDTIGTREGFSELLRELAKEHVKSENRSLKDLLGSPPEHIPFAAMILWATRNEVKVLYGTPGEQQVALVHHYKKEGSSVPSDTPYSRLYKRFGFHPPDSNGENQMKKSYHYIELSNQNVTFYKANKKGVLLEHTSTVEEYLCSVLGRDGSKIYAMIENAVDSLTLHGRD